MPTTDEALIRQAAFDWLREQTSLHGDTLPWSALSAGFHFRGQRVPLVSQQGIFKPRVLSLPLSIRTAPNGPYEDTFGEDGTIEYCYRGTDPNHRENAGLRACMQQRVPLAHFFGVAPGKYVATCPVLIVGDDPQRLKFRVQVDDPAAFQLQPAGTAVGEEVARRYATTIARTRLHQQSFRERVLAAYRRQCALCRLRHEKLLDATHITPDAEADGLPVVSNGLSLCKLHHAAYDANILGIRPDYAVEVSRDLLEEIDGPMLQHGLQRMHGAKLIVPAKTELRPDRDRLAARYEQYQRSA